MAKLKQNTSPSTLNTKKVFTTNRVRKAKIVTNKVAKKKHVPASQNAVPVDDPLNTLRLCFVKLRRFKYSPTNSSIQDQDSISKAAGSRSEPQSQNVHVQCQKKLQPTSLKVRKCRVRVQRTPLRVNFCGDENNLTLNNDISKKDKTIDIVRCNRQTVNAENENSLIKSRNVEQPNVAKLTSPVVVRLARLKENHRQSANLNQHPTATVLTNECRNDLKEIKEKKKPTHVKQSLLEKELVLQHVDHEATNFEQSQNNSSHNLANKTNIIEMLLSQEDIENVDDVNVEPTKRTNVETGKIFHRKPNASVQYNANTQLSKATTKKNTKKFRSTFKRKSSVGNVYEFLSESDTSKNNNDPAADIVRKMIEAGNVRVATRHKGTGKLIIKRRKLIPQKKQQKVAVNIKQTKANENAAKEKDLANSDHENDKFNYDDEYQPVPSSPPEEHFNEYNNNEYQQTALNEEDTDNTLHKRQHNDLSTEGTFSSLARSVLIQQAGMKRKSKTYQRKLLEVAQKFVSTPANHKIPPPPPRTYLSPIAGPAQTAAKRQCQPLGNASPWRVDDEAQFPTVFHFSRNSSNLPSYSSDFIPQTPKKQKLKNDNQMQESIMPELDGTLNLHGQSATNIAQHIVPTLSSFSSNDSNAENMPPPPIPAVTAHILSNTSVENIATIDENADIFNLRQLPNPRRTLTYRSPLKAINILEVVTLPTLTKRDMEKATEQNHTKKSNKLDLFGFEEFLQEDEFDDDETVNLPDENNGQHDDNNRTLIDKLQELKKWRPADTEMPRATSSKPIAKVFDNNDGAKTRQRCVKEMLCSTMLKPTEGIAIDDSMAQFINDHGTYTSKLEQRTAQADITDFFKDPDPQTTFDENNHHRTYVRPYKRKRKLRNNFVMFMDSDESGDEEKSHDDNNSSHDRETSDEKIGQHKTKRLKKKSKPNTELESFVHEFNDMCKEIQQYELIVE